MKINKTYALNFSIVVAIILMGWWWQHKKTFPATEDAYIQANIIHIAPLLSGRVARVGVVNNAYVNAGDLLVQLETDTLVAALEQAKAQYDIAQQSTGAASSKVLAARARLVSAKAAMTQAQVSYDRLAKLYQLRDIAADQLDSARAARDSAAAGVEAAQAELSAAQDQAGSAGSNNADMRAALANLALAQINLGYSRITAPVSGWVANVDIQPGAVVTAGNPMFSLVEDGQWWVDANFKETDLSRIRPGQAVKISVDMYPGLQLAGKVESLGAGSGAVFSLLPPQNATGNWVKVSQRFAVRIHIDTPAKTTATPLRVGASVEAVVDTRQLVGAP